jgi:alpha-beta hydrolase superfamily lysophospholipase
VESSVLPAEDGREIRVLKWRPDRGPSIVVQLLHGLGEHAGRYERFGDACAASGIAVFAHDHRGHGPGAELRGHFADRNGWNRVIADVASVNAAIRIEYPDSPVVMFGHSMGSYIAQSYLMRHPGDADALVLSASTFASAVDVRGGNLVASILAAFAAKSRSRLLNYLGFNAFNRPFRPARTEMDWLSRDEVEVDRFIADPLCGGPYSNALWRDLTGGLIEISSTAALGRIPADLPILITGGSEDPVGGDKGMRRLHKAYADTGHEKLTLKVYDGGRHEMLNEINREEFTADVIGWIMDPGSTPNK